jgi:hypothetical protein
VTVETINVPPQPRLDRRPTGPSEADPRVDPARLWRRVWWRSVLVPLTVLAPIVALAPTADHRFNIYWHGGLFRDNPLRIVPHTVDSLPSYLRMGNFRPFGRMLEKALDLAAYTITDLVGLPSNVSFRLVSFAGAIVLTVTAVLFAHTFLGGRGRPPSAMVATLPFAVGGGFIAAGSTSPAILFGGLYLLSGALVLGVAALVCRADPARPPGWWRGALLLLGGAALAGVNEIAYLALPFATAAVLVRGRGVPVRSLVLLWAGFLPVFGAVRYVIYRYCASGDCYRGSDITLGPDVLAAEPLRLIAWLPPVMWHTAVDGRPWLIGIVPALGFVALAALARHAIRDLPLLSTVEHGPALRLATAAAALLVLGATLAALNGDVQDLVGTGRWGTGWRDTAVTSTAGAIVLVALAHAGITRRLTVTALIGVLALCATLSTAANQRYAETLSRRGPAILGNRLAQEMTSFDRTAAGDARRCALRTEFRTLYADFPISLKRFDQAFDRASRHQAGVPFCAGAGR